MTLKQGCELPPAFVLECDGVKSYVEISTEMRCFACHQAGHLIADCPRRKRRTETTTTVVVSEQSFPELKASSQKGDQSAANVERAENLPPLPEEDSDSSDGEVARKKKRGGKKKKKLSDEETMPPPSSTPKQADALVGRGGGKRARIDAVVQNHNQGVLPSEMEVSDLSDCEVALGADVGVKLAAEDGAGAQDSGSESSASVFSLKGDFEVTPQCSFLTSEQIRSLLKRLYYRKSERTIGKILAEFTDEPLNLLPQIRLLQDRARGNQNFNEVSRLERILNKIEEVVVATTASKDSSLP